MRLAACAAVVTTVVTGEHGNWGNRQSSLLSGQLASTTADSVNTEVDVQTGCGPLLTTPPEDNIFCWKPKLAQVHVGDSVTWANQSFGGTDHTVTSSTPNWHIDATVTNNGIEGTHTFSYQFSSAGTYRYYCRIHGEAGTITVTA